MVTNYAGMTNPFAPFTPASFEEETGLNAADNDAIYLRWVNTQINYANYQHMHQMNASLEQIISLLERRVVAETEKVSD